MGEPQTELLTASQIMRVTKLNFLVGVIQGLEKKVRAQTPSKKSLFTLILKQ